MKGTFYSSLKVLTSFEESAIPRVLETPSASFSFVASAFGANRARFGGRALLTSRLSAEPASDSEGLSAEPLTMAFACVLIQLVGSSLLRLPVSNACLLTNANPLVERGLAEETAAWTRQTERGLANYGHKVATWKPAPLRAEQTEKTGKPCPLMLTTRTLRKHPCLWSKLPVKHLPPLGFYLGRELRFFLHWSILLVPFQSAFVGSANHYFPTPCQ